MKQRRRRLGDWPVEKRKKGALIEGGEAWYVLTKKDAQEYHGQIVAVREFPTRYGICAKVLAVENTIEEIKRDLRILGKIKSAKEILPVMIRPELDVFCYVVVATEPQIIRKGERQ